MRAHSRSVGRLLNQEAAAAEDQQLERIAYTRRKSKRKCELDLENLEVEISEYRLAEAEQVCPQCSGALHEMDTQERS